MNPNSLVREFAPDIGFESPDSTSERRLHDLAGIFSNEDAYAAECSRGNPLVYSVQVFSTSSDEGDLHVGFGRIEPGTVGGEFYMTKGHVHERSEMAEVYIGLSGSGLMLLKGRDDSQPAAIELAKGKVVYVPPHTAHRTVNTGGEPLCYFGIYSAVAGHDYAALGSDGFGAVVLREGETVRILHRGEELTVSR